LRNQHLSRSRKAGNPRTSVHGDPGKIITDELAFPGMQAAAHFKLE
jgi:hypothetical protein